MIRALYLYYTLGLLFIMLTRLLPLPVTRRRRFSWGGLITLFLLLPPTLAAQDDDDLVSHRDSIPSFILNNVIIDRWNVFDTSGRDLPFFGNILNSLHVITRERVLRHEIFMKPGDTVTQRMLDELERNLRGLGILSGIALTVVPLDSERTTSYPAANLRIATRDSWLTQIAGRIYTGGNAVTYGASIQEVNLLGYAYLLSIGADYSDVNDKGWSYSAMFRDPNVYGSHVQVSGSFVGSRFDKFGALSVIHPFYSEQTPNALGLYGSRFDGKTFLYSHTTPTRTFTEQLRATNLDGWFSTSSNKENNIFRWSLGISYDRAERDSMPAVRPAFENSVGAFLGLASLRRSFVRMKNVEYHGESLAPIGGMGMATLGKISPHNGGLDNVMYIGAEARQAAYADNLYGFASIEAGTGLAGKQSQFTMVRINGSGVWKIGPGGLLARFEETNVWNWPRYILQTLDNQNGLRAYQLYGLNGDNKMMLNLEYGAYPDVRLFFFKFGAAAFYDVGAVWNQSEKLSNTRFHSSAGIGLRISNLRASLGNGLIRFDFAYNFDNQKFDQIIISTRQAFSVFGGLDTHSPAPYVP